MPVLGCVQSIVSKLGMRWYYSCDNLLYRLHAVASVVPFGVWVRGTVTSVYMRLWQIVKSDLLPVDLQIVFLTSGAPGGDATRLPGCYQHEDVIRNLLCLRKQRSFEHSLHETARRRISVFFVS